MLFQDSKKHGDTLYRLYAKSVIIPNQFGIITLYTKPYPHPHHSRERARTYAYTRVYVFFAVTSVTTQPFIALKTELKIAFKRRIPETNICHNAKNVP